jgi:hypothetical protein
MKINVKIPAAPASHFYTGVPSLWPTGLYIRYEHPNEALRYILVTGLSVIRIWFDGSFEVSSEAVTCLFERISDNPTITIEA